MKLEKEKSRFRGEQKNVEKMPFKWATESLFPACDIAIRQAEEKKVFLFSSHSLVIHCDR